MGEVLVNALQSHAIENWVPDGPQLKLLKDVEAGFVGTDQVRESALEGVQEMERLQPGTPRPLLLRLLGSQPYLDRRFPVLTNLVGATTAAALHQTEGMLSSAAMISWLQAGWTGKFTVDAVDNLHRQLFGEVYAWAGRHRTVALHSRGVSFAPVAEIDVLLKAACKKFSRAFAPGAETEADDADLAEFLIRFLWFHPYREGNGRTALGLLLALRPGLSISKISRRRWYQASAQGLAVPHQPDPTPLLDIIQLARTASDS